MPKGFDSESASDASTNRWTMLQKKQKNIQERCRIGRHPKRIYSLKYDDLILEFRSDRHHHNMHQNYSDPCAKNLLHTKQAKTQSNTQSEQEHTDTQTEQKHTEDNQRSICI
eukprot:277021_1